MLNNVHMLFTGIEGLPKKISLHPSSVKTLAVVGFLFLVGIGILLAIYSSRFVPIALQGVDTATVALSQIFTPTKHNSLTIVPFPSILPFATSTHPTSTTTSPIVVKKSSVPAKKVIRETPKYKAGKETHTTYLIHGTTTPLFHGLPDFTTHIIAVGYLTSTSTNSFIATTTIPHNAHIAVKFSIKNIGTNKTGQWKFRASIPTELSYIFNSPIQKSLNPGDYVTYMLGFDQAKAGSHQMISITADANASVVESNETNNSASIEVTVLGN